MFATFRLVFAVTLLPLLVGCNPAIQNHSPSTIPSNTQTAPMAYGESLFLDAETADPATPGPGVFRSSLVRLNTGLLLAGSGEPIPLASGAELALNLFLDTVYTGIIEEITVDAGNITWVGYLKDVEFSSLIIVYTSGVFIGHFASPLGVYEFSNYNGEVYRIIQVNQGSFTEEP